jgi:hypothetical protein
LSFGCISYEFAYCVWLAVLLRFLISGRGFVCFGLPLFLPAIWLRSFALSKQEFGCRLGACMKNGCDAATIDFLLELSYSRICIVTIFCRYFVVFVVLFLQHLLVWLPIAFVVATFCFVSETCAGVVASVACFAMFVNCI